MLAIAALAAASACSLDPRDSCGVDTKDISMVATAVDNGTTVRAEADFEAGDRGGLGISLRLCDDDKLTINGSKPTVTERPDRIVYSLTVDAVGAPRAYAFELERSDDSLSTEVSLPVPFDITAPMPGATLSRAADVGVAWAPPVPDGELHIQLREEIGEGICLVADSPGHEYKQEGGVVVPDSGAWTIPAGVVEGPSDESCAARYDLIRSSPGNYPDTLESGGFVEGVVLRTVAFSSDP